MAREIKTTTIDGEEYSALQLKATKAACVATRLAKLLGAGVQSAQGGRPEEFIAAVLGALSEEDTEYLCKTFAEECSVKINGGMVRLAPVFDDHFGGSMVRLVKWLGWGVESNFADFLGGAGLTLTDLLAAGKAKLSNSPKAPTGASES